MAQSFEKVKIAADDLNLDTAGHGGSAVGGFTRKLSDGSVGQNPNTLADWNKFGADYVPHRDAPLITGANQPFNRITAADRDSERLMREMRISTPNMYNFEAYGGIPGLDIDQADAAKNTEVFDYILSQIAISGRPHDGIFFPGTRYEFMEWGGTPLYSGNAGLYALHILPMSTLDNITMRGSGYGSVLAVHASANTGFHLLHILDSSGYSLERIRLEHSGATGSAACVSLKSTAASSVGNSIDHVETSGGVYGVYMSSGTGVYINRFNLSNVTTDGTTSYGIAGVNTINGWVERCTTSGASNLGIYFLGTGDPELFGGIRLIGNNLPTGRLKIERIGSYLSSFKDFTLYDNSISSGDIEMFGVNEWVIQSNKLFNGGIRATVGGTGMTSAHNLHILDNFVDGGYGGNEGIYLSGSGCTVNGFSIQGGRIHNVNRHGIRINFSTGVAKWGDISRVFVLNNSREGAGTNYSSIYLEEGNASGGVMETQLHHNTLRNFGAATHPQEYGIECQNNGGLTDYILTSHNYVKGRNNATKVLTRGANSGTDEPAKWDGGLLTT